MTKTQQTRRTEMPKKEIHIVPRESGWAVRREGATRDSSHHDRRVDAFDAGRTTARRDGVELVTQGKNGRIQDSDSHGRDPFPPRG
jgi:hypothetical protein